MFFVQFQSVSNVVSGSVVSAMRIPLITSSPGPPFTQDCVGNINVAGQEVIIELWRLNLTKLGEPRSTPLDFSR